MKNDHTAWNLRVFDASYALLKCTYSFADGHSFFRHGLRVGHIVLHDRLEELVLILSVKRRLRGIKQQHRVQIELE